jgi:hypothetical protein
MDEAIEHMESKWRAAVEGMTFFGEPVQDMDAESLLSVIGCLVVENKRLDAAVRGLHELYLLPMNRRR